MSTPSAPEPRHACETPAPDETQRSVYVVASRGGKGVIGVLVGLLVLAGVAILAVYLLTMEATSHGRSAVGDTSIAHPHRAS